MTDDNILAASFRDPGGFVFKRDNIIYRQVNKVCRKSYDLLMNSGLYKNLVEAQLLIAHEEVDLAPAQPEISYRIIKPDIIPFISFPYEWCFSQLKDAALTTLSVQKNALEYGLSLKDASAYNIQFMQGKPVLIDTLSFEPYIEGEPWVAYRQFCQHFLAPLTLMTYTDIRLSSLLRNFIDGLPLDLTSHLLPLRTRFRFAMLTHIHLHAKSQKRFENKPVKTSRHKMSRMAMMGLIDNLESFIKKLEWSLKKTAWSDYYDKTNYSPASLEHKQQLINKYLEQVRPSTVWDLGANTGRFSRLASGKKILTVAFDIDPVAVEKNYHEVKAEKEKYLLPLLLDLTNPSPSIGWGNHEHESFMERGPVDTVLALALVHHLAIANNLPLPHIAAFFAKTCRVLIIEFVPKSDSRVMRLLSSREDIFDKYTREDFEKAFQTCFSLEHSEQIKDSDRLLYLMYRK